MITRVIEGHTGTDRLLRASIVLSVVMASFGWFVR